MKVVSYSRVIPPKNKSLEKQQILEKFLLGVQKNNDTALYHNDYDLIDCDVAVIQGWQHQSGKTATHLQLRGRIVDYQLQRNKYVCVADSNLFLYATLDNQPYHYLRYSLNGVFPDTGIYCDNIIDPQRWQQISKHLNIKIEPFKHEGKNILICLQRNGGWSMGTVDINSWIDQLIQTIRRHSDRPIVFRPHPKDNNSRTYLDRISTSASITVSESKTLDEDLKNAWCVVNHNSSSIVGAIIKGYPAFITDPNRSQCAEVAHTDFSKIEMPDTFDREKWLHRTSMFHWNFEELENGSAWRHMRNYCQ
jgi:hypothetical protein